MVRGAFPKPPPPHLRTPGVFYRCIWLWTASPIPRIIAHHKSSDEIAYMPLMQPSITIWPPIYGRTTIRVHGFGDSMQHSVGWDKLLVLVEFLI